ncbi:carbohydrate-binding protein CenC [Saccharomonospora sp. NPDC046836]|uniref:carbohydrate-binding protein CenC n=1 Tax=Saccharomonospora sp. NPDC046836 TaxID=3156921 RepID=UPI0033C52479
MIVLCSVLLAACSAAVEQRQPQPMTAGPYVYVGSADTGMTAALTAAPVNRFVLAFLLAGETPCTPTWNSQRAVDDPALLAEIDRVRAAGSAVTVATGGASGTYLENTCGSAAELAAAYRTALSATGADRLDLDIEAEIPVDMVADALAAVHADGIGITTTVEVLDAQRGLTREATTMVRALAARGVDVIVNAMIMNFPEGQDWQASLLQAAESVTGQIAQIWPGDGRDTAYRRLGLTFMAGRNDTGPVTTLHDARALREYAGRNAIGFLGFWSLGRDTGRCAGAATAQNHCSGVAQQRYAFTAALV